MPTPDDDGRRRSDGNWRPLTSTNEDDSMRRSPPPIISESSRMPLFLVRLTRLSIDQVGVEIEVDHNNGTTSSSFRTIRITTTDNDNDSDSSDRNDNNNDITRVLKNMKYKKSKENEDEQVCAVCLEEFSNGEEVAITTCNHSYHNPCITKWLALRKSCPYCRKQLF
ncbi:E3 ubiquitin-protein ligase SDIR1-like [Humulus lupulus]|uniref:E3 ubiquitin-protein ligase SDIR1-like n=1 Tax=Humulus lupulus TaxID=3486 RepID=UPI002B40EEC1|nr:E3 ubiquitin-protein ligase SDIR1-like [Humulus lupulus]